MCDCMCTQFHYSPDNLIIVVTNLDFRCGGTDGPSQIISFVELLCRRSRLTREILTGYKPVNQVITAEESPLKRTTRGPNKPNHVCD